LATQLDHRVIAEALGLPALAPRVLRLDPALKTGYARDLDILPNTLPPERHLGYAVQWFGLAAAVFITALVLTLRSRRRRVGASREKIRP
jgi:surfeit locus 1 family protein